MTAIRLLGDRVLVALPPKETTADEATGYTTHETGVSAGGIILATPTEQYDVEIATRGIVMQLGQKRGQVEIERVEDMLRDIAIPVPSSADSDVNPLQAGDSNKVVDLLEAIANLRLVRPAPFDVAVGDCVVFAPSAGEQFELAGINYVILREAEIIGVVAPIKEAA